MCRQEARLTTRLGWCEQEDPQRRCRRQGVDRRVLPIGRDDAFQLAPELIHRIEFRRLLGQPHESDVAVGRQRLRPMIGVAAGPIREQPDRAPGAVAPPQLAEERPHVGTTGSRANEHEAMAGAHIDRPEEHALGVGPRDGHDSGHPDRRPRRSQRWEEPQQRPVGEQHNVAGPNSRSQATPNSPFFCARCTARSV